MLSVTGHPGNGWRRAEVRFLGQRREAGSHGGPGGLSRMGTPCGEISAQREEEDAGPRGARGQHPGNPGTAFGCHDDRDMGV